MTDLLTLLTILAVHHILESAFTDLIGFLEALNELKNGFYFETCQLFFSAQSQKILSNFAMLF